MGCRTRRGLGSVGTALGLCAALVGCAEGAVEEDDPTELEDSGEAPVDLGAEEDALTIDLPALDASPADAPTIDLPGSDLPVAFDGGLVPDLPSASADAPTPSSDRAPTVVDAPTAPRDAGPPPAVCGDGILDRARGEVCDDGNQAEGDTCSPDCQRALCADGSRRLLTPNGRCYWRDPTVSSRADAVARCASAGGYLAVFETEEELNAVYPAVGLGGSNRVWAALQRVGAAWTWDNGAPLAFTGFRSGEPSGDGPCAEWGPGNNFNDLSCDVRRDAVCERPPAGRAP